MLKKNIFALFISLLLMQNLLAEGKVYLVLGSDTAIWDGLDVSNYHCYYSFSLYDDPSQNAYKVMDPSFRSRILDSYGDTLKLTWWMMAGNVYRFAVNNNIPLPNTMTLHLMKKYHNESIKNFGDELSLHYHTFLWYDYDGDGRSYWNQSPKFTDCRDDFDLTLAHFLMEENVFPVSFRSGWFYMDNEWQAYLNELIPYSLHADYPLIHKDITEPIDNNYDWSKYPEEFIAIQPSAADYQLPGGNKGWNTRARHISSINQQLMNEIFEAAKKGVDQIFCIWGHLPEKDFLTNIEKINELAHQSEQLYTDVKFKYCTATEAMQLWRNSSDFQKPEIEVQEINNGEEISFSVQTNEPIFQTQPFFVIKDINEIYSVEKCIPTGVNQWKTKNVFSKKNLAKVDIAVTDTLGNLATKFINYLPDDIYIDNTDENYIEVKGNWTSVNEKDAWDKTYRKTIISQNDTAIVRWNLNMETEHSYNVFFRIPVFENSAENIEFFIYKDFIRCDTINFNSKIITDDWNYITTVTFANPDGNFIEMIVAGNEIQNKILYTDVIKISPLVKEKKLHITDELIDYGNVSEKDTVVYNLYVSNHGIADLTIHDIHSQLGFVNVDVEFPFIIQAMKQAIIPLTFFSKDKGTITDTLLIKSDDPLRSELHIPYFANVTDYFRITDNEDVRFYNEEGVWQNSVAWANGNSSRFSYLNNLNARAAFSRELDKNGLYEILFIVPKTENASNHALYIVEIGGQVVDSIYIDQNLESGSWVRIGTYNIIAGIEVKVKVINDGTSTSGAVIRADAVKFLWLNDITNIENEKGTDLSRNYQLSQNYPNPFNNTTRIDFTLPFARHASIKIYNILGKEVAVILNKLLPEGQHSIYFDARDYSSGIYLYELKSGNYRESKKLVLLK